MDIEIKDLRKSFGEKLVLDDFSLVINEGSKVCIMGESGKGKTTLLNIIMGNESADSGSVSGVPGRYAAVFQEDRLLEDFSALTNVRLSASEPEKSAEILSKLGLEADLKTKVSEMSGGMKRRVAIARALAFNAPLLIMDEPFKGLDEKTREQCIRTVLEYCEGRTLIAVTHDETEAEMFGAKIIKM